MRGWSTLVMLLLASGCGRDVVVAAPEAASCEVSASLRPLVVDWAAADRGALEVRLRQGPVAARYEGCALEILPRCEVPGALVYTGITRKQDRVAIRDADELRAQLTFGALRLASRLARAGELQVDMTLVGAFAVDRPAVRADELRGRCDGATHVLTAAQVGAFAFYVGGRAEVAVDGAALGVGAGGKTSAERELLTADGDPAACAAATTADRAAPAGCGALVRVEFLPLAP